MRTEETGKIEKVKCCASSMLENPQSRPVSLFLRFRRGSVGGVGLKVSISSCMHTL